MEKVVQDVEKYTLANHLFWGIWGIISVSIPTSRFNLNYKHERVKYQDKPCALSAALCEQD